MWNLCLCWIKISILSLLNNFFSFFTFYVKSTRIGISLVNSVMKNHSISFNLTIIWHIFNDCWVVDGRRSNNGLGSSRKLCVLCSNSLIELYLSQDCVVLTSFIITPAFHRLNFIPRLSCSVIADSASICIVRLGWWVFKSKY